eukprot:jgi/Ulvmu1/1364/UM011_0092.1
MAPIKLRGGQQCLSCRAGCVPASSSTFSSFRKSCVPGIPYQSTASATVHHDPATGRQSVKASAAALAHPSVSASQADRSPIDDKYLWGLIWSERVNILIALACAVTATCSNLASPVISGYLLEILAGRQPVELYPTLLGAMAVMYTIEPLLGRVYVSRGVKAAEGVLTAVRLEVFRVLLMQPVAFFDRRGATEITNILAVDLETIRASVFGSISRDRGLRAVMEAAGSVVVLFCLSCYLAPVLATVIIGTSIAATIYRKVAKGIEARLSAALRCLSRVAGQAFANIRTVRAFAGENLERERFVLQVKASYHAGMEFAHAKAWLEAANRGSIHLSLIILFGFGGWLVLQERMPLRVMLTGIGFTYSLLYATQGTVNTLADVRKATSALERVRELLSSTRAEPQVEAAIPPGEWWLPRNERASAARNGNGDSGAGNGTRSSNGAATKPARPGEQLEPWLPAETDAQPGADKTGSTCPYPFRPMPDDLAHKLAYGDIALQNVSFAYPMQPERVILQDVNFTLKRGKITALVGRSGAGKSTVVSLIERLYTPQQGSITMGGMDISAWSRDAWASSVALVAQDPVLFTATIADNIAYGAPRASRADIIGAASAANAHEFIEELPDGYDTMVGETGMQLSGGQRQRVAIARALLKDAPVLILDEATSSLDMRSEALVNEAVARLVRGRTVLVIAHRLSTIQRADCVFVMADGRVVEEGSTSELLERGGYYSELVKSTLTLQA